MAAGRLIDLIDLTDDAATAAEELGEGGVPLFAPADRADLHHRWAGIDERFATSPREAAAAADALVADALETLARRFSYTKAVLETQWDHGLEADPKDVRRAYALYRLLVRRLVG